MSKEMKTITNLILKAAKKARRETSDTPELEHTSPVQWPASCTVGPGLEGAIACESKIGYVNGSKGWLIYRGYDIFDLCAYSTFEEVCYLLIHGNLPTVSQLASFKNKLIRYRFLNKTLRLLMGFEVENMNAMGALRMGTNLMRQEFTELDQEKSKPTITDAISSD
ncbi:MAG: citrate/2-methylcitrate synthase, partial [Deltaproteobacteria bacterium]|nr:citrate/2-methylcitrate synthase [Deltaproteobacteria bacterium]